MLNLKRVAKDHVWCIIICAGIIVFGTIIFAFGSGDAVEYMSFGSSLTSIVLAVIVIIYMYFQTHQTEYKTRDITQSVDKMRDEVSRFLYGRTDYAMTSATEVGTAYAKNLSESKGVQFNIEYLNWLTIIIVYALVKSSKQSKRISLSDLSTHIAKYGEGTPSEYQEKFKVTFGCAMGIMDCLNYCLGSGTVNILPIESQEAKLPPEIMDNFSSQIDKFFTGPTADHKLKQAVNEGIVAVDRYFEGL